MIATGRAGLPKIELERQTDLLLVEGKDEVEPIGEAHQGLSCKATNGQGIQDIGCWQQG